jgi:hypothetical protein
LPAEPFVPSGDARGSTCHPVKGQQVGRPMPHCNQTLTGRSPNAPSPSVSATLPLTSLGPTSETSPGGRERRRLSGGILASRTVRYARGCLRADVPPWSKGHGVDHLMHRCQGPRRRRRHCWALYLRCRHSPACCSGRREKPREVSETRGTSISPVGWTGHSAWGCLWGDVSSGPRAESAVARCAVARNLDVAVDIDLPREVFRPAERPRETFAAEGGGNSCPLNHSFRPGMPVGRRSTRSNANGLVARCPVAIKR